MLIVLFPVITAGCLSNTKGALVLPPEPQREERPEVQSVSDMTELINYYEHLVQSWEAWGEDVKAMINP